MKWNDMQLRTKILGMLSILLSLVAIVAAVGVIKMQSIGEELKGIAEEDMPLTRLVSETATNQLEQAILFERILRLGEIKGASKESAQEFEEAKEAFRKHSAIVKERLKNGEKIGEKIVAEASNEEAKKEGMFVDEQMMAIEKEHKEYETHIFEIATLLEEGKINEASVLAIKTEALEKKIDNQIEKTLLQIDDFTEKSALVAERDEQSGTRLLWMITIIALIVGMLIGTLITNSVLKQLGGDPSLVADICRKIATGDLTLQLDIGKNSKSLLAAMKGMIERLHQVAEDVKGASDNVAAGSQQLSSASQQMSQGATEQAASIEETSSSMEEMSANIQQNTDNAIQTEKIASKAAKDTEETGQAVNNAVQAMKEISEKISIIEEIARQTNLLALNAAIEAARAGEHGKGFAVVASEVRKLAERSQAAAGEITQLSGSSMEVATKAGEMLGKLVPDIKKTADLVQEISAASREQNSGVGQITKAVQQLDQVIQQNAGASEEMSATSEELASQAEQLLDTIGFFKLNEGQKHAATHNTYETKKQQLAAPPQHRIAVRHLNNNERLGTKANPLIEKQFSTHSENKGVKINLESSNPTGDATDKEFERF